MLQPYLFHLMNSSNKRALIDMGAKKSGFSHWLRSGTPFQVKLTNASKEKESHNSSLLNGSEYDITSPRELHGDIVSPHNGDINHRNETNSVPEEENEDLLADFIDEDSQPPSQISKSSISRRHSSYWNNDEVTEQTGSSLSSKVNG